MLMRTLKGLSISIRIGLFASLVSTLIALLLGGGAAVCGGWVDRIVLWLIDLMQGMPHLVLMIFLSILVGRGIPGVMIGVAATHRVSLARIVRAETIHLRASPYIIASRQMGRGRWFIARAHFPPHIVPQALVSTVLMFPHAILHESGLTFLGFGIPGQLPAVGVILSESVRYLSTGAWWLGVLPGLALLAIVLVIDRCGDSLQALVSPASAQNQELVMPLLEIDGLRVGFMMYRSLLRRAVGWAVDGLDCAPRRGGSPASSAPPARASRSSSWACCRATPGPSGR